MLWALLLQATPPPPNIIIGDLIWQWGSLLCTKWSHLIFSSGWSLSFRRRISGAAPVCADCCTFSVSICWIWKVMCSLSHEKFYLLNSVWKGFFLKEHEQASLFFWLVGNVVRKHIHSYLPWICVGFISALFFLLSVLCNTACFLQGA